MVLPDADATTEALSGHVSRSDGDTWFGHPRQLARLFTIEAWERFGYYGMRALLVLYLTNHFLFSDRAASGIYGGYTALVYLTPLIGGWLADNYLGSKRSVKFGAVLMAAGYFTLCFGGQPAAPFAVIDGQRYAVQVDQTAGKKQQYLVDQGQKLAIRGREDGAVELVGADGQVARTVAKGHFTADGARSPLFTALMLLGLSAITIGNGFFKPNISTIVGALYAQGDRRRDAGFTIFYMGINLGSLFSQFLCPLLATLYGWWAGFLLAAVGMSASWALMQFDGGRLAGYGEPPARGRDRSLLIYALALLCVPFAWLLYSNLVNTPEQAPGSGLLGYVLALPIMGKVLFFTFLVSMVAIPIWSWRSGTRQEAQMMLAAILMLVFNVFFMTLFEQAGSSLTLFADRNTNLSVFGLFSMSAGQTQVFNPLSIVVLAPLVSALWAGLAKRGLEPSIPVKFAFALFGAGLGFFVLVFAGHYSVGADFRVSIGWLALLYVFHSAAELCIQPVGLSMITKLAMARIVGMMMGMWFLSISVAQYVAGAVAQIASVETVGGEITNPKLSLDTYLSVFQTIGLIAIAAGAVLLLLAPVIKRLMHGVR
ncbi:peptide MFS transporter [Sphingomonas morindae]|uniref:Peptide MFS transporter n=1 Tax=Sphingomonas morindae TaxID=1541170 RepID=A0ABY4X5I7_9SPHN|nr:peptide MFS transporter [Sphingomonas morindae]USI72141.1 peptide MFS transporter [Sphingomonas morindae]